MDTMNLRTTMGGVVPCLMKTTGCLGSSKKTALFVVPCRAQFNNSGHNCDQIQIGGRPRNFVHNEQRNFHEAQGQDTPQEMESHGGLLVLENRQASVFEIVVCFRGIKDDNKV